MQLIKSVTAGGISIHSLRVEGDQVESCEKEDIHISIHSLRVEGDSMLEMWHMLNAISIHSLRVEGDGDTIKQTGAVGHFNPLPPCGGRHYKSTLRKYALDFNPLPPCGGRLTTPDRQREWTYFNPLPPCGGRPSASIVNINDIPISIHSLRVEGDFLLDAGVPENIVFQSTPSVWRETDERYGGMTEPIFQSTPSVWRETLQAMLL